jgi:hypothetical protein
MANGRSAFRFVSLVIGERGFPKPGDFSGLPLMLSSRPLYSGTVISRRDEEQILGEYRNLLTGEEDRLKAVQREIDRLRPIVRGIEERLQARQDERGSTAVSESSTQVVSIRHGRPTFAASVRQIMDDGEARDATTLLAELHARDVLRPDGHRAKQMQKVSNALVEMTKQGYLMRPERGMYKLASTEAPENGAGRGGPIPSDQPGVQKPPGEEVASPRPGHTPTASEGVLVWNQAPV